MLYLVYRIIAILLIIGLSILVFGKKCLILFRTKVRALITVLLIISLFYASLNFAFEINWIEFDTCEDAFRYSYTNDILKIIEEENCAFVVYEDLNNSIMYTCLDKCGHKWKAQNPYFIANTELKSIEDAYITKVSDSEGSKVLIIMEEYLMKDQEGLKKIEDNQKSKFVSFSIPYKDTDFYTVFTYVVIEANIDNYELKVDGKVIEW